MKLLIDDGMQIQVGTGIGKYTKYLYQSLLELCKNNDDHIELSQYDKGESSQKAGRIKYLLYINSRKFKKMCGRYDIVHFTNYAIPIFRNKNVKYVATVHDLASFLYPESLPIFYKIYNQFVTKYAIRHADAIFTVSQSVKCEISEKWPSASNKVTVLYPGLYSEFSEKNINIDDYDAEQLRSLGKKKFFLFTGTIEKRKNLGIVIDAFLKLKEKSLDNDYKLVLAGRPGFGYESYKKQIEESGCAEDIITTGYVSSEDCYRLYQNAAAYVFPSVYEGFGSTQLECMVNHLPLILSDIPTNREVSEGYGLFFDLTSTNSLVEQMCNIIDHNIDENKLIGIANRKVKEYFWGKLSPKYYEAYLKL